MATVDWPALAQMLTAASAICALFLAPKLAGRNEQRKLVASNRQAWLDALRSDLAELIALWMQVIILRERATKASISISDDEKERVHKADHLIHKIRLRLNLSHPNQKALFDALSSYIRSNGFAELSDRREAVNEAMEKLVGAVWSQIKSGAT